MKSRFICIVSSPNLWEDHHHLILSLRPAMGIQRAGYHTAQSAGKGRDVPLAHLDGAAAAQGERWLLATLQIAADWRGSSPPPSTAPLHTSPPLFFFFFYENQIFIAPFNCSSLPFFTALIVPLEYGLETAHPCPSLCYLF